MGGNTESNLFNTFALGSGKYAVVLVYCCISNIPVMSVFTEDLN